MSFRLKHAYKKGDASQCTAHKSQKSLEKYCDHLDDAHFERIKLCNLLCYPIF